jgi:hypothetical protein
MSLEKFSNKMRSLADARREWLGESERNVWELSISIRDQLASQDIDKIYSLLGIVKAWAGLPPLRPDYHLSATDVYHQVAIDTMQGTKFLLPLQFNLEKKRAGRSCPRGYSTGLTLVLLETVITTHKSFCTRKHSKDI